MALVNFEAAPAKLNLFLHVLGKRQNGYHDLESLAVFLNLSDVVSLIPNQPFGLTMNGSMAVRLESEGADPNQNLVVKAACRLSELSGKALDFGLHLEKNIPVQAGLGGGSADAAACLRLLCKHWKLDWQDPDLMQLALSLGADVPVCMHSKPTLMRGIGENLEPAKIPPLNVLLTNPLKAVSTQTIFQRLNLKAGDSRRPPLQSDLLTGDFESLINSTTNDLQTTAEVLEPTIKQSLEILSTCGNVRHVRMTGSGATCFALFDTLGQASASALNLGRTHPDAWFWSGTTI